MSHLLPHNLLLSLLGSCWGSINGLRGFPWAAEHHSVTRHRVPKLCNRPGCAVSSSSMQNLTRSRPASAFSVTVLLVSLFIRTMPEASAIQEALTVLPLLAHYGDRVVVASMDTVPQPLSLSTDISTSLRGQP
ncbi:hypothetical protein C8J57DRAFT_1299334 [Mycena rebaudengoi]|nr:hypothetical protein C8J57DRAFT_1299334 [Mycena rebaudengoi]